MATDEVTLPFDERIAAAVRLAFKEGLEMAAVCPLLAENRYVVMGTSS